MKENDIIERLHKAYDIKEPDVLSRLDFSQVEMVSSPEKSLKKRYWSAAAIYAAACLVITITLPFLIGGGGSDTPKPQPGVSPINTDPVTTTIGITTESLVDNTEILNEFMAALERAVAEGRINGEFDRSCCFEVTPDGLISETGARLFKFADTNYTFIYADGEAYEAQNSEDSPGISGAVAWDYDGNGKCDILMSVPQTKTGGVERTHICVFNMDTKSIVASKVVLHTWAAVTKTYGDGVEKYPVYDVSYAIDANKKMLSVPKAGEELYGYVEFIDGEIVFVEYTPVDNYDGTVSIDVYPIPVESSETEPAVVTTESPASPETEPAVVTTEPPTPPDTTTAKRPEIAGTSGTTKKPDSAPKVYGDPADHVRVRFFKDAYIGSDSFGEKFDSVADIPYGAKVYYKIETDPGYICTNFSINVFEVGMEEFSYDFGDRFYYPFFVNEYSGDKLEYSVTAVLAGDADGNLMYDQSDVDTLNKYLAGDTTTLWLYGHDGYSEKLDYNCDGVINVNDRMQMQTEINTGTVNRRVMPYHKYSHDVGTITYLLPFDDCEILPHGRDLNSILTDGVIYNVYDSTASVSGMSDEIRAKYNDSFFEAYDLVLVYCYTDGGKIPVISEELGGTWYTSSRNGAVLNPIYKEVSSGETLSEYAICIPVSKSLNIQNNYPM